MAQTSISPRQIRRPVRRNSASLYMLIMLVSFSTSVVVTRLFLTLTGFPKIGRGEIHIAHLLWGGLLLFIAATLLLVLANRWAYLTSAVCAGVGAGLFMDEVGKFITTSNNYFYPLAMPIIYGFFLIIVLVYLQVRKPPKQDSRSEMYRVLEMLPDLLDRELEEHERQALEQRLKEISEQSDNQDLTRLATILRDFLASPIQIAPERPGFLNRLAKGLQQFEERWIGRERLKLILVVGMAILGFLAIAELIVLLAAPKFPDMLAQSITHFATTGEITGPNTFNWFLIQLALEGTVGILLVIASILLIVGEDQRANELGYFGLLMSLTVVNLLLFYFDQFGNLLLTIIQIFLLAALVQYRQHYIFPQKTTTPVTAAT
ncbi:MAG TPA: hypothetical protein VKQ72_11630 [Aggregatilineales bacterium]|nr:hypothetical protein [Aggregatilineales bacterium]